jgi:hypothetical protein
MTTTRDIPIPQQDAVSEIWIDIVLTLLTCGIYGLFWQARQFRVLNGFLGYERYNFMVWLLLTVVTCGVYHIINQYMMARSINAIQHERNIPVNSSLPGLSVVLSIIFYSVLGSFIVDALHQNEINEFYGM